MLNPDGSYSKIEVAADAMPYSAQGALLATLCHR
jgi:hypothetical protein